MVFLNNIIVRLQHVELINFKNIKRGTITFPSYTKKEYFNKKSEIIGLYGQNGSGKTALVDAMQILKHTLQGERLPESTYDYIFQTANSTELKFVFYIEHKQERYLVFYEFEVSKAKNLSVKNSKEEVLVKISKEKLSYKKYVNNSWKSKRVIIDYDVNYKDVVFKPIGNFKEIVANTDDNQVDIKFSKKWSENNSKSFIFSDETRKIINACKSWNEYNNIINCLNYYASTNLFVIKNNYSGLINMNFLIPLSFRIESEENITQGDLAIELLNPSIVSRKKFKLIVRLIKQMNIVMDTIIPGLSIEIKDYGQQMMENGFEGIRMELLAAREEVKIPLKYESDGIKKIISILSTLIAMYNNNSVCMVVDELDAGIFEYLLGEILQIIDEGGKGQLIFTSHNLRPLEKLDRKSLIFTTTDPKNRYIRFSNVQSNNNLRSLYYRSINLGGQNKEVYKETNSYEISRAFRLAGRTIIEN